MSETAAASTPGRMEPAEIDLVVKRCPALPSLRRINKTLRDLLSTEQSFTTEISEIIRRDPSLTARLLRLVNSVYYGLRTPVSSIEEAVFYLGIRQIRQLAFVTPILEDFQKLTEGKAFPWREFWKHCVGSALLTREVASRLELPADDVDYVAGLVHDVGKIVLAAGFPDHFAAIYRKDRLEGRLLIDVETEVLGVTHAELGAMYLQRHHLPEVLVAAARHHHQPAAAGDLAPLVAAVQLADVRLQVAHLGFSGQINPLTRAEWERLPAWSILLPESQASQRSAIIEGVEVVLKRLPLVLDTLL